MSFPKIASPEEALKMLSPILPELYAGFENGLFEARDYFNAKHIALDRSALSMLVRLHVKDRLAKAGLKEVTLENPSLCGLHFVYKDIQIRVWKSEDHNLPDPGPSEQRQAFYQYSLGFPDGQPYRKFAILWNLDDLGGLTLWLVCPKNFDAETRVSELHWYAPIIDPTKKIKAQLVAGTAPKDLPITRKDVVKKTNKEA